MFRHTVLRKHDVGYHRCTECGSLQVDPGGHVFFYSRKALETIASRYGYALVAYGSDILFVRGGLSKLQLSLIKQLVFRGKGRQVLTALLAFWPKHSLTHSIDATIVRNKGLSRN